MISSKLYILVVATLAAFAVASPTDLGESDKLRARAQCAVGSEMCCSYLENIPSLIYHSHVFLVGRKTRGSVGYRKVAIEKLGALVGRNVNSQSIVWVGCSTNISEDSHHTLTW